MKILEHLWTRLRRVAIRLGLEPRVDWELWERVDGKLMELRQNYDRLAALSTGDEAAEYQGCAEGVSVASGHIVAVLTRVEEGR